MMITPTKAEKLRYIRHSEIGWLGSGLTAKRAAECREAIMADIENSDPPTPPEIEEAFQILAEYHLSIPPQCDEAIAVLRKAVQPRVVSRGQIKRLANILDPLVEDETLELGLIAGLQELGIEVGGAEEIDQVLKESNKRDKVEEALKTLWQIIPAEHIGILATLREAVKRERRGAFLLWTIEGCNIERTNKGEPWQFSKDDEESILAEALRYRTAHAENRGLFDPHKHQWAFVGKIPCTGPIKCTLCGVRKDEV